MLTPCTAQNRIKKLYLTKSSALAEVFFSFQTKYATVTLDLCHYLSLLDADEKCSFIVFSSYSACFKVFVGILLNHKRSKRTARLRELCMILKYMRVPNLKYEFCSFLQK